MTHIIYTESYNKKAAKFIKKHPELAAQYQKTLQLLELNPRHPSLKMHKLKGKAEDLFAVSINISYRILLFFFIAEDVVIPVNIGTHDEVY